MEIPPADLETLMAVLNTFFLMGSRSGQPGSLGSLQGMSERPRSGGQISRLPYSSLVVGKPPGPLLEHDGVYGQEATADVGVEGGQRNSKEGGGGINCDGDRDNGGGERVEGVSSGSSESLRSDATSVE